MYVSAYEFVFHMQSICLVYTIHMKQVVMCMAYARHIPRIQMLPVGAAEICTGISLITHASFISRYITSSSRVQIWCCRPGCCANPTRKSSGAILRALHTSRGCCRNSQWISLATHASLKNQMNHQ